MADEYITIGADDQVYYGDAAHQYEANQRQQFQQQNQAASPTSQPSAFTPSQSGSNTQPAGSSTAVALPDGKQDGPAQVAAMLAPYGLEALAGKAWAYYQANQPSDEEFMYWLRSQDEYKRRFAGMAALQKKGRAISESEYIGIEKQYVQLFRQAGLPEGFYDSPDDFASFIGNEVSPQEMSGRLEVARTALYETPPEVRQQLAQMYGLGSGDVMAFLLDPTKALPIIQQQFTAAAAGAASRLAGFGMLTRDEAEKLAAYGAKTFDQYAQGFDQLAQEGELFNPIIGEGNQDRLSRDEQIGSVFGGNTAAQRRLERRARERAAQFAGGGSFAQTREGTTGLGSAVS